jgi:hypothetical protein
MKLYNKLSSVLIIFSCLIISGCFAPRYKAINPNALYNPMNIVNFTNIPWPLQAWIPKVKKSSKLRIYIEGDGRAWIHRSIPSADPTPKSNLVHNLLAQDQTHDVAYLSQPCQFIMNASCNPDVWTFGRYSATALQSMNTVIDKIKKMNDYSEIELVGYSGGAAMALLLAAHRNDVTLIRTVAGNLVPSFTNEFHNVTPMPEAINPLDFANKLSTIKQIHFVGNNDNIIPINIANYYRANMPKHNKISIVPVAASHAKGWVEHWQELLVYQPVR